jgi:predicted nuclease of predicted toxin-antitoxin system
MRILIDECIDERFRHLFPNHDCQTAHHAGLAGLKNGELIAAAERNGFRALLTVDQGFAFEQNLSGRRIAVVILHSKSNRLRDLLLLVPACLECLDSIQNGQVAHVRHSDDSKP